MKRLNREQRARILHLLCEGNSIRSVTRLTGASKNTVVNLMIDAGKACAAYHDANVRNLKAQRIQVDEIWAFVYSKNLNVKGAKAAPMDAGDVWTWTAIDADTKLIATWYVGDRTTDSARIFLGDLKQRVSNRMQLTSDGHRPYLKTVEHVFGDEIDYAVLHKIYGPDHSAGHRYSPPVCVGAQLQNADAHASVYAAHKCLLKEGREPCLRGSPSHDVLQFREGAFQASHIASHGRWRFDAALGDWRHCRLGRSRREQSRPQTRTL